MYSITYYTLETWFLHGTYEVNIECENLYSATNHDVTNNETYAQIKLHESIIHTIVKDNSE